MRTKNTAVKCCAFTCGVIARSIAAITLLWACLGSGRLAAKTYFVAPNGDDAATGTRDTPFATIQKAAEIANVADEIATFAPPETRSRILEDKQLVIANNLTGPFHDLSNEGGSYNRPCPYQGERTIEADPLFVNPKAADFHLQPRSPAIGLAKKLTPFDSGPDLGALPARQ